MTDWNRDKTACLLAFSLIKCWKGKETKLLKPNSNSNPRKFRMNARWSMRSLHENEMGKREIWWQWWLQSVEAWWIWSTSVCQCPANTTLLLMDLSWLMQSLSGVSGFAMQVVHNPGKPSVADWEAIIADPALWQEGDITPCEFPDNASITFLGTVAYSGWNSQMPEVANDNFNLPHYLLSKLNLFLMSLLKLDTSFHSKKSQQMSSVFSSSF